MALFVRGQEENDNDETGRLPTCMQSSLAFIQAHPAISEAELPYVKGNHLLILEKIPSVLVMKQSYPDDLTKNYRDACEAAGGIFASFTGVFDCKTRVNTTRVSISENLAKCMSPGPECEHYTTTEGMGAADWQLDMQKGAKNECQLREGSLDNIENALSPSSTPMPPGEPQFVSSDPDYSSNRRRQCMDAFGVILEDEDSPLENARWHQLGKSRLETIQESPILTQIEYYPDDDNSMYNYMQLCQDSGGNFSVFSGVLDCIGIGSTLKDMKTTTVVKNSASCFPAIGCEGYTLGRWKLDTMRNQGLSCSIRPGSTTADLPKPTSSETKPNTFSIGSYLAGCAFGLMLVVAVFLFMRHRKQQQSKTLQESEPDLDLANSDEQVELPSVA